MEIYAQWEADKNFHTTADKKGEPYSIVIPPPNVTGQLFFISYPTEQDF